MLHVVKFAADTERFLQKTDDLRDVEKDVVETHTARDLPPVFNKRLFASQGTVVLTQEARRIMKKNIKHRESSNSLYLNKKELQCMRSVVDGLKLIHKGQDYIKDVLSHVITFETYNAFEYIVKRVWEECLSCYYIIHGAVEVTYDMRATESRNVYQPNIIYSHSSGEYVGLVNAEGRTEDLAPPATVYTKEVCHLLKIDRQRFHRLITQLTTVLNKEKQAFLRSGGTVLSTISRDAKEKILNKLQKKEFTPNKVLLKQGEVADYLILIMSGRCECYRDVFIPEVGEERMFYLDSRESGDFFGEECVVDNNPSYCTIVTSSVLTCYKLHRSALEIMSKEQLANIISANRHSFPSDDELRDRGYSNSIWNNFKHSQIKEALHEGGKMKYLRQKEAQNINERPPSLCDQHRENMFRFIDKGAHFQPMRTKSAVCRSSQTTVVPPRAQTSMSNTLLSGTVTDGFTKETEEEAVGDPASKLMSGGVARALEKFSKELDSDSDITEIMEGDSELSRHLRQAWEVTENEREENDGFMENGVLVTMKTDDIVRKAKAIADQFVTTVSVRDRKKQEEEWNTILHAENKQAKLMIAADKYRVKLLRKRLEEIEKKRTETNQEKYSPGEINIAKQEETRPAANRKPFFLETLEKLSEERSIAEEKLRNEMCDDDNGEHEDHQTQDRVSPGVQADDRARDTAADLSRRRLSIDTLTLNSTDGRNKINTPRVRIKSAAVTRDELEKTRRHYTDYLAARLVMKESQNGLLKGKKRPRVSFETTRSHSSLSFARP
ncbi:hypothetical protein ScPMuIL_008306 [Solemya velum]